MGGDLLLLYIVIIIHSWGVGTLEPRVEASRCRVVGREERKWWQQWARWWWRGGLSRVAELGYIYIEGRWPRPAPERIDGEMERGGGNRAFVMLQPSEGWRWKSYIDIERGGKKGKEKEGEVWEWLFFTVVFIIHGYLLLLLLESSTQSWGWWWFGCYGVEVGGEEVVIIIVDAIRSEAEEE